jgi:hypothetical protein
LDEEGEDAERCCKLRMTVHLLSPKYLCHLQMKPHLNP